MTIAVGEALLAVGSEATGIGSEKEIQSHMEVMGMVPLWEYQPKDGFMIRIEELNAARAELNKTTGE